MGKYNIKKGIGVFPLNEILSKSLKSSNGNLEVALTDFSRIINNSKVVCDNWIIGGDFSAFNSKSGFKTIEEYITNKKSFNEEIRTDK